MWRNNFGTSTPPAVVPGDYNTNGSVDATDYVLWRATLGSTTNLQANGDDSGPSAWVIDQADYAVWRNNFGTELGAGSEGSGELGMGSGEGGVGVRIEERGASGADLRFTDFGFAIGDSVGQVTVVNGDSPSPRHGEFRATRPTPGRNGGIGAAIGGRGWITAPLAGESDLLLLLRTSLWDENSNANGEASLASAGDGPAAMQPIELVALDVAFAGVGQSGIEGVSR